jgi:hypothetical protein
MQSITYITYIRSSSNIFGFMQLNPPTKLIYYLDLLRNQVHKDRSIGSKSNAPNTTVVPATN